MPLPLYDVLVPAVTVTLWAGVLGGTDDVAQLRGFVFAGGPLVLLAGLHARISDYLHAPERIRSLPLPLATRVHWSDGLQRHRIGFMATVVLGAIAVFVASWPHGSVIAGGLVADWLWLGLIAWFVEPLVPALSSFLGRRMPDGTRGAEVQRSLSGGATLPEAAVHLWVPAFGVGLAAAIALPGQLSLDRFADGGTVAPRLIAISVVPVLAIAVSRAMAPRWYGEGVWEAVPWLHEATRTLAGPPLPPPRPFFVAWFRRPAARAVVLQFWRGTPVPWIRLGLLLGWAAVGFSRRPEPVLWAAFAALSLLWLLPARGVIFDAARRRLLAPLPDAGPGAAPALALLVPVLASGLIVLLKDLSTWPQHLW